MNVSVTSTCKPVAHTFIRYVKQTTLNQLPRGIYTIYVNTVIVYSDKGFYLIVAQYITILLSKVMYRLPYFRTNTFGISGAHTLLIFVLITTPIGIYTVDICRFALPPQCDHATLLA